jgi:signal transduction histidine kinase
MAEAPAAEPVDRVSATLLMSVAAVASALISIFGHGEPTGLTVAMALVGLVPWALVAGGVDLAPWQFAVAGLLPAGVSVLAGNDGAMFPAMLVVVWVTRTSRSRFVVGATVAAALAMSMVLAWQARSLAKEGSLFFAGGVGIAWLAGVMVRRQEELTDELRELHDLNVEHAAVAERARIAREVHDVVGHSLSVVMLHLTGARRVLRTDPDAADEALARAEEVGRQSMESIRQVVGLLRDSEGHGRQAPMPGLAEVAALVDGFRRGGMDVAVHLAVADDALEPAAALAAYRVVQESLTNVLRHAPGAACRVELVPSAGGRQLAITVENGPPAAPHAACDRQGTGVRGMAERIRAVGGELSAGPTPDGGWAVRASLPVRPGTVAADRHQPAEDDEATWPTPTTAR